MPFFIVNLRINVQEYEKRTNHLIEAKDINNAKYQALSNESHVQNMTYDEYIESNDNWIDDGMIYEVINVQQIPNNILDTIKIYLS